MSKNVGKTPTEPKYHISQKGLPEICRASVRRCPLGGMQLHRQSLEEITHLADQINSVVGRLKGISLHKVGSRAFASNATNQGMAHANNMDYNIHTLESISKGIRSKIASNLNKQGIKSLKWDGTSVMYMSPSQANVIDIDKFNSLLNKENFEKDSVVEEYVTLYHGGKNKALQKKQELDKMHQELIDNAISSSRASFRVRTNSKGEKYVTLDEETIQTIEYLAKIEHTIELAKEYQTAFKEKLKDVMKTEGVTSLTSNGGITAEIIPEETRKIPDTKKLRDYGVYDNVSKTISKAEHIRVKRIDDSPITYKPITQFAS